jgi:hypothetical protein
VENPATWKQADKIVYQAMSGWYAAKEAGVVGLSITRSVTDALRKAGYLNDSDEPEIGFGDRAA